MQIEEREREKIRAARKGREAENGKQDERVEEIKMRLKAVTDEL